jgi:subtilase family serine protease
VLKLAAIVLLGLVPGVAGIPGAGFQRSVPSMERLRGHLPVQAMRSANWMGRMAPDTTISMAITLPLRNQDELKLLLSRLYDPTDPLYGNFLTPEEFADRFSPTQADYDLVAAYARNLGLTVTRMHSNRLVLDVSGPVETVESAFNLHMHHYQTQDGRDFHAPDDNPEVPDYIGSRVVGLVGLENAAVWHMNNRPRESQQVFLAPLQVGTGPGGGLSPADIRKAYSLDTIESQGTGQVLGLFELDGYNASDVIAYENYFGLSKVPLQNVLVDGFSGRTGSGASEVTLDIELMIAVAQQADRIIVYEGPNTNKGVLDTYNRIATDNLAKQVSSSWGLSETQSSAALLASENAIFQQMAAQGQSVYAASGDNGAYDNGATLSVDDPASQPFVVGVGGTHLYLNNDGSYNRETTWNNGSVRAGAGGGGVSSVWVLPDYQQSIAATSASSVMRNVPDVALNSDPNSGYSIYYRGRWYIFGGTSCAAPLWAAFTAIINQQRIDHGGAPLGFANPAIYQIGGGGNPSSDFYDIADGSTNLYYTAITGFDNATGWGSIQGASLFADLALVTATIPAPSAPQNLNANAGDSNVSLTWNSSSLATGYILYRSTTSASEGFEEIAAVTVTSYVDTGLTNHATYYYAVAATNNTGTSGLSNVVSAQPEALTLAITAGPIVSRIRTSATIQWTTNIAADSTILYGTSPGILSRTASSSTLSTSHVLMLSGLFRATRYYYQVISKAGGIMVSSATFSFTTQ